MTTPQAETITCPECGLVLQETREANGSKLVFDVGDWRRCCKRPGLDSPLWCFVQRDATSDQLTCLRHWQRGN